MPSLLIALETVCESLLDTGEGHARLDSDPLTRLAFRR
jgi:hypothetical protein